MVRFAFGTQYSYDNTSIDPDTLYFTTDSLRIYKGSTLISSQYNDANLQGQMDQVIKTLNNLRLVVAEI